MIAFMPLMSIHFPANSLLLFSILSILNGDILILQQAYDHTLGRVLLFQSDPLPYNERFQLLGYESVRLLDNSGVFVLTWVALFSFLFVALLLRKSCERSGKCCQSVTNRMVHCVVWSPILRTFIETFVELGFCAFLNILYVSGTHSPQISFDSVANIVSSGLSIVILLILLMLPFIILHILGVPPDTLTNKAYKDKFGEIYENTQ